MKYKTKIFSLLFFSGIIFGITQTASAAGIALLSQGQLSVSSDLFSSLDTAVYTISVGTGYTGTSTGATLAANVGTINTTSGWGAVSLVGFSDNTYTTEVSNCTYSTNGIPNGTLTSQFPLALVHAGSSDSGTNPCTFDPSVYYQVQVSFVDSGNNSKHTTFYGTNTNLHPDWYIQHSGTRGGDMLMPYFAILSGGFQLTPTTGDSGVLFSGAVQFCNDAFASTSAIGATIGNGLCIAVGFLFIPSSDSYNQFTQLPTLLDNTPPISWFAQLAGIYQDAQASSSPNFINLSIDFGATSTKVLGFQKLDVISTTTVSKYMPESVRQTILALEGAVFLASAASAIYFTLKHVWKTT